MRGEGRAGREVHEPAVGRRDARAALEVIEAEPEQRCVDPAATRDAVDLRQDLSRARLGQIEDPREARDEALTRRARETGDASHYERSLEALAEARRLVPAPARADKVEAWVRLGRHEFALAESLARAACAAHPDDPESWGLLGDALMEQGSSDAAADAWQRMMDLRPGPGAYLRASYWRERAGDLAGAKALRALGREAQVRAQEDAFLREALANQERPDNENLFLVDFFLERRPDPPRALAIAEREASAPARSRDARAPRTRAARAGDGGRLTTARESSPRAGGERQREQRRDERRDRHRRPELEVDLEASRVRVRGLDLERDEGLRLADESGL